MLVLKAPGKRKRVKKRDVFIILIKHKSKGLVTELDQRQRKLESLSTFP